MIPLYNAPPALSRLLDPGWPVVPAEVRRDDEAEAQDWIGYESVHPLTWVPPPATDA